MFVTPPYLYYLFLGEAIFVQIAYTIVIYVNAKILYSIFTELRKRKIFISPILIMHSGLWIIIAFTTLLHNSYALVLWRPTSIIYEPKYFYVSAMLYFVFMPATAVCLFFSTIERCFVFVIFNRTKLQKIQKYILITNVFFVFLVCGIMIEAILSSTPNPFPIQTTNLTPGAMSLNNQSESRRSLLRLINFGFNFIAVAGLTILLKKTKATSTSSTLKNQRDLAFLVQKTILIHTVLDLFIHCIALFVVMITGESASNVFGSYSRTLLSLDGLFCCMTFAQSINKIRKRTTKPNASTSVFILKKSFFKRTTPTIG